MCLFFTFTLIKIFNQSMYLFLCLCLCLSSSLYALHTHTHTHTQIAFIKCKRYMSISGIIQIYIIWFITI